MAVVMVAVLLRPEKRGRMTDCPSGFDRGTDQAKRLCSSQGEAPGPQRFLAHSNFYRECNSCSGQPRLFAAASAQTATPPQNSRRFVLDSVGAGENYIRGPGGRHH